MKPSYKPGQQVRMVHTLQPWSEATYTVITYEPVYQKNPFSQKIREFWNRPRAEKTIISYKYRCKSSVGMKDFLQDELTGALLSV